MADLNLDVAGSCLYPLIVHSSEPHLAPPSTAGAATALPLFDHRPALLLANSSGMIRAMATTVGSLVSEQLWWAVQPLLPALPSLLWRSPCVDDRDALAGIVYQLPTGLPWRRLLSTRQLGGGSPVTCWRRLRDWPARASTTSARRPSVVSVPVVCRAGSPSVAVRRLIGSAAAFDWRIAVSSDFEPGGLHGAITLLALAGERAGPWRLSAADYVASDADGEPFAASAVPDTPWDPRLAVAMRRRQARVSEESRREILLDDLRE